MTEQHSPVDRSRERSILVVDDDHAMCRYCASALRHQGYQVTSTTSSTIALEHLRQQAFDLLLTDIRMPLMSGLELVREARLIHPTLAVIIMSGQTTLEMLREAVQTGVTSYLSKPFETEELRLTVAQVVHQRTMLREKHQLATVVHQLRLSSAFSHSLSLDATCTNILTVVRGEIGSQWAYFLLTSPDEEPRLLFGDPLQPPLEHQAWLLLQQTLQTATPTAGPVQLDGHTQPVVVMPLLVGDQLVGSVLFDHRPALAQSAIDSLELLMRHAAAALHNASLFTKVQEAHSRLQELDRLKSEFVAITSHELRTPLAIVLGYAMLLHDQAAPPARDYLQRMLESGQRLKTVIDDMTTMRQVELRQTQLSLETVELSSIIEECIGNIQSLAQGKRQTIVIDDALSAMQAVWLDRDKMILVLTSLLSNAIKFTPLGGTVTLRAWCERVQTVPYACDKQAIALSPGLWAFISVQDSGIGIPAAQQRRIFERFYQIADSLTREHGGTGLGLALAQGLVAVHNGHIWVSSQEGSGSTFTIALPQAEHP